MYFTVVVTAYFEDGTFDESITFPVEILDPCGSDKVSFDVPPSDLITYILKMPSEAAFDPYIVRQTNPGLCPVVCTLRDSALNQNSVPSITRIDPVSGAAIKVETPLKNLDGKLYSYELRCESTLTQLNEGTAYYFFQVRFYDECNDATITPPYFEDFDTEVFLGTSVLYAPAQSDKECGGFTYSIATPITESWPQIGLQNGQIFIEPTLIPTHVGPWDVRLTAYLELNNRC